MPEAIEIIREIGRRIGHPMGLLPRLLHGSLRTPSHVIATAAEGSPISHVVSAAASQVLSFSPRQALRVVPRHGPVEWLPRSPEPGPVVVLGSHDAEVHWGTHWNIGFTAAIRAKVRRLDSVAPSRARVGAVVLSDGAETDQALAGGAALLERDLPLVVMAMSGLSPSTILQTLAQLPLPAGYGIFDSMLIPLRSEEDRQSATVSGECWFAALPQRLQGSRHLMRALEATAFDRAEWLPTLAALLQSESRSGGVHTGYVPPAMTRVAVDENLQAVGFYPTEGESGAFWRWIGPAPEATICLPRPFWGPGTLTLTVTGTSTPENVPGLRVFIDGELSASTATGSGQEWTVTAPFSGRMARGSSLVIHLDIPVARQIHAEDPRRLAICLSHLTLSRS